MRQDLYATRVAVCAAALLLLAFRTFAQVTPAAGYAPPDDTPSVKVGGTIFADYTYVESPRIQDSDKNTVNPSAFNLTRADINVTGNILHRAASAETVTNAAQAAVSQMPKDFRVSITNAPGKNVYPISSFTWLLFYENPKDKVRARAMKDFMQWALTEGQKYAPELGYAPLPPAIAKLAADALTRIRS